MTENTQQSKHSDPELPTQYTPADVEGPLYERWVERGYFEADEKMRQFLQEDVGADALVRPRGGSRADARQGGRRRPPPRVDDDAHS